VFVQARFDLADRVLAKDLGQLTAPIDKAAIVVTAP